MCVVLQDALVSINCNDKVLGYGDGLIEPVYSLYTCSLITVNP